MSDQQNSRRIAVMTFIYEGDRHIGFDMLESLVLSFKDVPFDLFFTDDASPSRLDLLVAQWAQKKGINAYCVRYDQNLGLRGAVDRTLRLLEVIANHPVSYDVILRIDTDALVIREGLGDALLRSCPDAKGLYGVLRKMRPRDRLGLFLDMLPVGLKRTVINGAVQKKYNLNRLHPVWWWTAGVRAFRKGFGFRFIEGACYAMGGQFPSELKRNGFFERYRRERHGLITSEEDVIVTLLCRAAELPLYELDKTDPRWKDVNILGYKVLERDEEQLPYVIHELKANARGDDLRRKVKEKMSMFNLGR